MLFQQPLFTFSNPSINRAVSSYDFEDTFDTDTWTKNDAGIWVVSGGVVTITIKNDSSNDAAVADPMGTTVSDTLWTLDFDYKVSEQSASKIFCFGLSSSDQTVDGNSVQDFIGIRNDLSSANTWYSRDTDGAAPLPSGADNSVAETLTSGTQYYFTIRRLSATTYSVVRWTDGTRTTAAQTASGTCASTTSGLRYIKYMNRITTAADDDVVILDNVKFADGVDLYA